MAGYLVCKGLGATLPKRWITDYDGSFTSFGATLFWIAFIGTAGSVFRLLGYTGYKNADQPPRRDDPWY